LTTNEKSIIVLQAADRDLRHHVYSISQPPAIQLMLMLFWERTQSTSVCLLMFFVRYVLHAAVLACRAQSSKFTNIYCMYCCISYTVLLPLQDGQQGCCHFSF
jgi:hypothetical protein